MAKAWYEARPWFNRMRVANTSPTPPYSDVVDVPVPWNEVDETFGFDAQDQHRNEAEAAEAALTAAGYQIVSGWRTLDDTAKDGEDWLFLCEGTGTSQVMSYDDEATNDFPWLTLDGPSYHEDWPTHYMPIPTLKVAKEEQT